MKVEIYSGFWTVDDVKNNPNKLFVFGDNNARIGKGGQAIIRDLPNSIGLRTKKGPSNKPAAFYSDTEIDKNIFFIREDILRIKYMSKNYDSIVLSDGGYGTGLASLEKVAPKTFEMLNNLLIGYFSFDNKKGKIFRNIPGYDAIISGKYISLNNSDVLNPINNSFFLPELLSENLNTLPQLIKCEKKVAFTSPEKYKPFDVILMSFENTKEYLVCQVKDSYLYDQIDLDTWSYFEGFITSFISSKTDLQDKELFQTQIEFICTLDERGNMLFKDNIFGKPNQKQEKHTIIGQPIKMNESKDKKTIQKENKVKQLLLKKGITGNVRQINSVGSNLLAEKTLFQVKSDSQYYKIQLTENLFSNSIDILEVSKLPFI